MALPPNPPSPPLHLPTQPRNLTQLRYDLRKLKAHALLARDGSRYAYQFTEKGIRVALMFILFHQRICGPLANTLFHLVPTNSILPPPNSNSLIRRPMLPFNKSSIYLPLENSER
jgi:hypothetical protein